MKFVIFPSLQQQWPGYGQQAATGTAMTAQAGTTPAAGATATGTNQQQQAMTAAWGAYNPSQWANWNQQYAQWYGQGAQAGQYGQTGAQQQPGAGK